MHQGAEQLEASPSTDHVTECAWRESPWARQLPWFRPRRRLFADQELLLPKLLWCGHRAWAEEGGACQSGKSILVKVEVATVSRITCSAHNARSKAFRTP